jgi:hypothetical protein
MIESLYDNGLVLLGIWVSMSLVMLLFWGVLAWAVVNIISRQGSGRRWGTPPPTDIPATYARPSAMTRGVARSDSEMQSAVSVLRCLELDRVARDSGRTDVALLEGRKESWPDAPFMRARPTGI